jgi:hypothetical protein
MAGIYMTKILRYGETVNCEGPAPVLLFGQEPWLGRSNIQGNNIEEIRQDLEPDCFDRGARSIGIGSIPGAGIVGVK